MPILGYSMPWESTQPWNPQVYLQNGSSTLGGQTYQQQPGEPTSPGYALGPVGTPTLPEPKKPVPWLPIGIGLAGLITVGGAILIGGALILTRGGKKRRR